ncbi:hypothetical protein KSS87_001509 [Heliosperma pusillum]|nr:hypothetical protein KSS87_001509 [Heliosperma pusillum]
MKKEKRKKKRGKRTEKNEVDYGGDFIEGQIHLNARENDPRTKCTETKFPITILNCLNPPL